MWTGSKLPIQDMGIQSISELKSLEGFIYLHTALLASFEADASAKMNFRHGMTDLNISSLSSEAPSWTSRRTIQLAAATCSSPLPRFRHRSKESHIVTLLKRPNSCHLSIRCKCTSLYIIIKHSSPSQNVVTNPMFCGATPLLQNWPEVLYSYMFNIQNSVHWLSTQVSYTSGRVRPNKESQPREPKLQPDSWYHVLAPDEFNVTLGKTM